MPGMDGVEFVARLRGHRDQDEQPTPVIAVTPSPTSTRASALRRGFRSCLVKPVDPPALRWRCRTLTPRARRSLRMPVTKMASTFRRRKPTERSELNRGLVQALVRIDGSTAALRQSLHFGNDHSGIHRLDQVCLEPRGQGAASREVGRESGQSDDGRRPLALPGQLVEASKKRQAVHTGHRHIRNYHVWPHLLHHRERGTCVRRRDHQGAVMVKHALKDVACVFVVIHQQHVDPIESAGDPFHSVNVRSFDGGTGTKECTHATGRSGRPDPTVSS